MVLGVVRDAEPTMGAPLAIFARVRKSSPVFFCSKSIVFLIHLLRASIATEKNLPSEPAYK